MSNHDEVFDPTQDGLEEDPVYRQYPEGKYLVKFTQYEPKVSKAGNNMHEISLRVEEALDDQDMTDTENNFPLRFWLQHRSRDKKTWRRFIGTFNAELLEGNRKLPILNSWMIALAIPLSPMLFMSRSKEWISHSSLSRSLKKQTVFHSS